MNNIKFIPLIEPPTKKNQNGKKPPEGTSLSNSEEWNQFQLKEIQNNYRDFPTPILSGIYLYRLFDLAIEDLQTLITLHISDTNISDSCSLFGGYAISIDEEIVLYPQCCGLLEEIQTWKQILDADFHQTYLKECHPSPLIRKAGNKIEIICKDQDEHFFPETAERISLDLEMSKTALRTTLKDLEEFEVKLNTLSPKFGVHKLSDILIWGNVNN